jgi:hypothetical protein
MEVRMGEDTRKAAGIGWIPAASLSNIYRDGRIIKPPGSESTGQSE